MADIDTIAKQFLDFYYQTFDAGRGGLATLYSLPLDGLRHNISTTDVQPFEGGALITVTGQLLAAGETNPQFFTQTFALKPDGGSFYVQNDIFRLVYGL
ncbi:Nuclear transport factor 2 [Haplosporangium sp. Z 27]|nr:Nuclear transport factor 2 [Haplosporangium sp. Z 27]